VGYGGGDFALHDGVAYWVEQESARIYRQDLAGGPARPVTPGFGLAASPAVSPDGHWLAYLHSDDDGVDRIAVVDSEGLLWPQVLVEGHDFFSQPRWSPDGKALAWIAWDHPNMPWDGSTLYVAQVVAGDSALPAIGEARAVAGGPDVAVFQPEWSADGSRLLYVSDESGWGQLYAADLATGDVQQLTHGEAEHGTPAWVQDMRTYAVSGDGLRVYITRQEGGFSRVQRLDLTSGRIEDVVALREYTCIERIAASPVGDAIAVIASAPRTPTRVVVFDGESGSARVVARSSSETVPASELAAPESLSWATGDGEMAHGLFYPPQSTRLASVGAPPLVVLVHGGPTSQSRAAWSPAAQFLATRGYGVLMLNYRGSTGYGRDYMLRLRGNWGVMLAKNAQPAEAIAQLSLAIQGGVTADGQQIEGLPLDYDLRIIEYYSTYGLTLARANRCAEAVPIFQMMLSAVPDNEVAVYNAEAGLEICQQNLETGEAAADAETTPTPEP
jgi:dipeptidyl aminopeptidase/acylaminoacyl peptidase